VLVARSGPDTLEFQKRDKWELRPNGYVLRQWSLLFTFGSTEPDSLVTNRSEAVLRTEGESGAVEARARPWNPFDRYVPFQVPYESPLGTARDIEVDLPIFRVLGWKDFECPGLMDASLDELHCPPFLLRFAGEGESCWLSVSMGDGPKDPQGGMDPSEIVSFEWAAQTVTVVDAKGRVLVRGGGDFREDVAVVNFSTHAKDAPPPPGDPTIQYPVTVRLRVPEKWRTEVKTFRFRGLPAPPPESGP